MCGIIGNLSRVPDPAAVITEAVVAALRHRGPDGSGIYVADRVQLGHTRLAIIDLTDAGKQPMLSQDKRYAVTYNGEIYNFPELRSELEALGEKFISHSDTEVLLIAYKVWGNLCVRRFRGMFAFALWDDREKTLFMARDRCGEKPIYYFRNAERLIFASELKALLPLLPSRPDLDVSVVDMYLHYQYTPEPYTLLKGVYKLPAAHTLTVTPDDWNCEPKRYWDIENTEMSAYKSSVNPLELIRHGIEDSVKVMLRSDVPVGVALSGGIDSGVIAALAQKNSSEPMHAFCVGYPGRPPYDERHQARSLAESLGMIVHEIEIPVTDFVDFFPELTRIMDEPIADPAAFGHYSVPKAAAEIGIKVLLSGIGGDEIFWGYPWVSQAAVNGQTLHRHRWLAHAARAMGFRPFRRFLDKAHGHPRIPRKIRSVAGFLRRFADRKTPADQIPFYIGVPDFADAFNIKGGVYGPAMAGIGRSNPFIPTDIGHRDHEDIPAAIIRMLFDTWLTSNCLTLGDRVSMGVSVETRLPFLDTNLIELTMALRANVPDHSFGQKAWLRKALAGVLPPEVLSRPKAGFQPPVMEWLSGVISRYGETLRSGKLVDSGIIAREQVNFMLRTMPGWGWHGLFFVYKLVLLETWYTKIVGASGK